MSEWSRLDRALRDLTQAEPPRHLHARVMARIEGIAAPEAAGWQIRWGAAFAVPALIAAALIAAVWMSRAPESVPPLPSVALGRIAHAPQVVAQAPPRMAAPLRQPRRVSRGPDVAVEGDPEPESSIPADERPQPIALTALSPAPVEVSAMEAVTDLTIAPLSVEPLGVPDQKQP